MIHGLITVRTASIALLDRLSRTIQQHPQRITAAVAAILLTGGGGAFAVASFAKTFGPPEYFLIVIAGLLTVIVILRGNKLLGALSALIGAVTGGVLAMLFLMQRAGTARMGRLLAEEVDGIIVEVDRDAAAGAASRQVHDHPSPEGRAAGAEPLARSGTGARPIASRNRLVTTAACSAAGGRAFSNRHKRTGDFL